MSDIDTSTFSETAASNNAPTPNGWPEGQAPSTVNDCARELMGAVKREWNRSHHTVSNGGSTTVLTLTYTTAPAAYVQGLSFSYKSLATIGADPTINVNSLGAKKIYKNIAGTATQVAASDWYVGQIVVIAYDTALDAAAGGFWWTNQYAQGAVFGAPGYTTTATAAGTTTLTVASTQQQYFTGTTTQTVTLPVTTTLVLGFQFEITNDSTDVVTVNSSGGNAVVAMVSLSRVTVTCILASGTTAASWNIEYTGKTTVTGTGSMVLATSPTLTTPDIGTPSAGVLTNVTGLVTGGMVDAAVTLAKMANLAQDAFIVRTTASTGVPQTATVTAAARTVLDDTTVAAMVDTLGGAASTGTGGIARATSPAFTTPDIGAATATTISMSGALTNTVADGTTPMAITSTTVVANLKAAAAGGTPINSQSAAYTTVLADQGKSLLHPTADNNTRTFTIDSNANVAYPVGTVIEFENQINTLTIALTTDTLTLQPDGTTGSITLIANQSAVAKKVSTTEWVIIKKGAVATATVAGLVPVPPNNTTTFLRGDATFAAPAGGGGTAVIARNTFSAVATVAITGFASATYDAYKIFFYATTDTAGNDLHLRTSTDGGSTYDSGAGAYSYAYMNVRDISTAPTSVVSTGDTKVILNPYSWGSAAGRSVRSEVTLTRPDATSFFMFNWTTNSYSEGGQGSISLGEGTRLSAADVDAVRFSVIAGTITGSYVFLGIKNA